MITTCTSGNAECRMLHVAIFNVVRQKCISTRRENWKRSFHSFHSLLGQKYVLTSFPFTYNPPPSRIVGSSVELVQVKAVRGVSGQFGVHFSSRSTRNISPIGVLVLFYIKFWTTAQLKIPTHIKKANAIHKMI